MVRKMYTWKLLEKIAVCVCAIHFIKVGAESSIIVLFESLLLLSETIHECVVDYR